MPCHPDRVRRNYHRVTIHECENPASLRTETLIVIEREAIASAMSLREVKRLVLSRISDRLDETYG